MQMETRYGQDMKLADSGLKGLELVTEMFVSLPFALTAASPNRTETVLTTCTIHPLYSIAFPDSL